MSEKKDQFVKALQHLINQHSMENSFGDIHDFILAEFMVDCAVALKKVIAERDRLLK